MDTAAEVEKTNPAIPVQRLPIPTNPVVYGTLRALYAGGPDFRWTSDSYGQPHYRYESRDGYIGIFCDPPYKNHLYWPEDALKRAAALQKLYMIPRWNFIYAGILRDSVRKLSVETADVFLILMSKIARLPYPGNDIARIDLEEIAGIRGVRVRRGSRQKLMEDLKQEVLRLSDLRVMMSWQNYRMSGTMTFGRDRPDRLLDIVDVNYKRGQQEWTSFGFRCGQALAAFLNPGGLRWIGYFSKAILRLDPYHEAFTKKLGTYWTMIGITAGKKGAYPRATPRTILDFCGERANLRNPGKTVDGFIKGHNRLREIGVLEDIPALEPPARNKGYFDKWLDSPLSVRLAPDLWKVAAGKTPAPGCKNSRGGYPDIPDTPRELQSHPQSARQFRTRCGMRQDELARALGITRQTLSHYERGMHPMPENTAALILKIWRQKIKTVL